MAGLAAGVLLAGAVTLLRAAAGVVAPGPAPRTVPVPSITAPSVAPLLAPGVTVAEVPGPPATPSDPEFVPGEDIPVLRWAPVAAATGYDVRWQAGGHREHRHLSATPRVALSGVPSGSSVSVEVRAVDAAGRRSAPLRIASGSLQGRLSRPGPTAFADSFSSIATPDRSRWRLPEGADTCLSRGGGEERGLLVVGHGCGTVTLRPAAPLVLRPAIADGSRGRLVLVADGPGPGGELVAALLPGATAGLPPGALDSPPPQPGTAVADPVLPPGAVLLRLTAAGPALALGAAAAPPVTAAPQDAAAVGVPTRWELDITGGAVRVLRDDSPVLVAGIPTRWDEATAVIAVRPADPDPAGRTLLDAVRLTSRPQPPRTVRVLSPGRDGVPAAEVTGATAVRLLGWLPAVPASVNTSVAFGDGPAVPLVTAGAGGAVTADLPVPDGVGGTIPVRVDAPPGAELADAVLEVIRPPGLATTAPGPRLALVPPPTAPVPAPLVRLLLDEPLDEPLAPLTLDITVDAAVGQAVAGRAGGYVGLEVDLGGRPVLGLPTARDGPAAGGTYRVTLDPGLAGGTALTVRVVPAEPGGPAGTSVLTLPAA